jgi:hypothetical protein
LNAHFWTTPSWLMQKALISKIKEEGGLLRIQNLQLSALNRILSVGNLNRILSSRTTLMGKGLYPDEILNQFLNQFFIQPRELDDSFKTLQIRFTEKILELSIEDELNPKIKSSLEAIKKELHRIAKKKSKTGTKGDKNHYLYLKKLTAE